MNLSILINSFRYLEYNKIVSINSWIYQEACLVLYSDDKLIRSFYKQDYDVTENIIHLIKDKTILDKLLLLCFNNVGDVTRAFRLLYNNGAKIAANKNNILRYGSHFASFEIIKIALEAGADVHIKNEYAFSCAIYYNRVDIVKLLIQNSADIYWNDNYFLRHASYFGYTDIVKLLIQNGVDVHAKNDQALISADAQDNASVVKLLIDAGANVDIIGIRKLYWFCYFKMFKIFKPLYYL